MILTVFRSRLNPAAQNEYDKLMPEIVAAAEASPGFISRKSYVAEDGERLSLVEFSDEESQRNWALNSEHLDAQQRGREQLYSEYRIQLCNVIRESKHPT